MYADTSATKGTRLYSTTADVLRLIAIAERLDENLLLGLLDAGEATGSSTSSSLLRSVCIGYSVLAYLGREDCKLFDE